MQDLESLLKLRHEAENSFKAILNSIKLFHSDLSLNLAGGLLFDDNIEAEKMFNLCTGNFGLYEFLNRYHVCSTDNTSDSTSSFLHRRIEREIKRLSGTYKIVISKNCDQDEIKCSYGDEHASIDIKLKIENGSNTNTVSSMQIFAYEDSLRTMPIYEHSIDVKPSKLQLALDLNQFPVIFDKVFYAESDEMSSEFDFVNMHVFAAFLADAMIYPDNLDRFGAVFGANGIPLSSETIIASANHLASTHQVDMLSGMDYVKRLSNLTEFNSFYLGNETSEFIAEALLYYSHNFASKEKLIEVYASAEHLNSFKNLLFDSFKKKNAHSINEMKSCLELSDIIDTNPSVKQSFTGSVNEAVFAPDIVLLNNSL